MPYPSSFASLLTCLGFCVLVTGTGCSDDAPAPVERVGRAQNALTQTQSDVLGFETLSGWSVTPGTKLLSTTHSEGKQSLAVTANGWTEVDSIALSSLGTSPDSASVDLRLPNNQANQWWWGALQMYVSIPSQNIYNVYLGQTELTGKPLEQFVTSSFPVPASLKTALGNTYSDLRIKITLNVPPGNDAYLLDNLRLGQGAVTNTPSTCDPYQQVATDGDLRFQLTTLATDTTVRLQAKKNGVMYLDRLLLPSDSTAPGIARYSLVDDASNYHDGDVITSQFSFERSAAVCPLDASPPWTIGGSYAASARVSHEGQTYEARQAVTARAGEGPSTTLSLWQIPNDCRVGGWLTNTSYKVGNRVAYQGKSYEVIEAHTSQSDWQPPNAPSLWRVTTLAPNPPSGAGAVTVYKPGPTADDWTELKYGALQGCTPVADRDGDGVSDGKDVCPDDARYGVTRGVCDCNVAVTDSDGDGTPDCRDLCPLDKARLAPGDCGCADAPTPQGRFCDDGGAPGAFTCDGAGHCGPIDAGRPSFAKGVCVTVEYGDSIYISCPSDKVSWTDAAKLAPAGYQLARVDSADENEIVAGLLKNGGGTSSWLDGLVTSSGVVSHTADGKALDDVLWDESKAPKNVGLRYFNWVPGQPPPAASTGCQTLASDGTWTIASCGELRSVVYERSNHTLTVLTTPTPITAADFPGLIHEPNREPGSEPCVDHDADYENCRNCLTDHADDPVACQDACAIYGACELCLSSLGNGQDPQLCADKCGACELCQAKQEDDESVNCDAQCANTTACTAKYGAVCEVTVPDPAQAVPCTKTVCPPGQPGCTEGYTCDDGSKCGVLKLCGDCGKDGKPCDADCTKMVCGGTLVNPDCGLDPGGSSCREELACIAPEEGARSDELKDDMKSLTEQTPPVVANLPPSEPEPKREKYLRADEEGAAAGTSTAEAWCHYKTEGPTTQPHIGDGKDETSAGKKGNKVLQFSLDPNVTLDYQLEALPLGQIKFKMGAQAQLTAKARVNFAGIDSSFTVLDALLAAKVSRCGYGMNDSHILLFNKDFLPPLLAEANLSWLLDEHNIEGCEEALKAYQEIADRVKKAMRDAQELVRQYHAALEGRACFKVEDLCNELMAKAPAGFVAIDCGEKDLKVETIINLFIYNYERLLLGDFDRPPHFPQFPKVTLPKFSDARLPNPDFNPADALKFGDFSKLGGLPSLKEAGARLSKLTPDTGKLNPNWADQYGCGPGSKTIPSTLFTKPFMLGPIPMLLEVQSVVKYGLNGKLDFGFHPDKLVGLAMGSNEEVTVASVTSAATPCVSAGLGLFVGAGFKGFGFRASAGVEGVVNLGTISAPAEATASIKMSAEDEALGLTERPDKTSGSNKAVTSFRELSDDLKGIWDGKAPPIPQRRFNVNLDYNYGLSVGIDQILAGHLKADLQIRFLFFKKRWSKYLANFGNGFSLGKFKLIGGEGDLALHANVPWVKLQMPSPFVNFRYLDALPEGVIGALPGELPNFDIPVSRLGNLGWDSELFDNITVSAAELSSLGGLAAALEAKGIDVSKLTLADLTSLGITLDKLSGVPLTVADLDALKLSLADLASLGIELPQLASDRLDLRGFSLAHVGALDLPNTRLSKLQIDWRDLPELSYRLRRTELAQALRNAGVDLTNLTLPDFFKLSGITIDSFRAWPLTAQHVATLELTTAELKKMGIDLTGFNLRIDGDPETFVARGLDLSSLSLASLSKLGLDLSKLGAIAVDAQRLLELNTALGYSDIRTLLAAAGVTDLEHVKLSDLGKLQDGLDTITGKLSSSKLGLGASELVKLGYGSELAGLQIGSGCAKTQELDTGLVGKFFYERQCACRAPFDDKLPYEKGEQSCNEDADCCGAAPFCSGAVKPGYNVCSTTPSKCGAPQTVTVSVDDHNESPISKFDTLTDLISKDYGAGPKICDYHVYIESGSFDDRGAVRYPGADAAFTTITNEPVCADHVLGVIDGRVDVTNFVRQDGRKLDFQLQAQDECGTNVGYGGVNVTYEVSFEQ